MNTKIIPYFQFPATICFIDDDELFAETAKYCLQSQNKIGLFYQNPQEVLDLLANKKTLFDHAAAFRKEIDFEESDDESTDINAVNYQAIIDQVYDGKRFNEISVFVVDYSMPEMTGLDFFKKIKKWPQKKIMLTGHEDNKMAVEAFNDGLIDKFIVKDFKELKRKFNTTIDDFARQYFSDFSQQIFPTSKIHGSSRYIKIFETWLADNNIVEYYCCDANGSYFGFDEKGAIVWLVFSSDKQIEAQIDMAVSADADKKIISQLKQKKKILFLFSEVENKLDIDEWSDLFFPVKGTVNLDGEKFYYAVIKDEFFSLRKNKLKVFGAI